MIVFIFENGAMVYRKVNFLYLSFIQNEISRYKIHTSIRIIYEMEALENQTCTTKFYFLKQNCKFDEYCCYSHEFSETEKDELLEKLKAGLEIMKQKNRKIETKKVNWQKLTRLSRRMLRRNLKPCNCCNTNKRRLEINLRKSQEVNEKLIDDIKTFNDKMIEIVPRTIIQENKELKETLNVLHAVIDIYKQAEVVAEENSKSGENRNDNLDEVPTNPFSIVMIVHLPVNQKED